MAVNRRSAFFLAVAVVCLLLLPVTPSEFRWVDYFTTGLAAFWAVVLALEVLASRGRGERSVGL